jgi:hypothetical protein
MTDALLFYAMFASIAIFAICVVLRLFVIKKIVRSSGGMWAISTPFANVREEREALRKLSRGKLRAQYKAIMAVALCSWLIAMGALMTHKFMYSHPATR